MPDVVVIPIEHGTIGENSSYFQKMVFYRDTSKSNPRLLVVSKNIVEDVGGFDPSLGFGEDKLFQEKVFSVIDVGKTVKKKFKI